MSRHQFISEEQFKVIEERVRSGVVENRKPRPTVSTTMPCVAGSNPASSPYKSKLESAWANYLHGLWMLKAITHYYYEPLNLRLPGKKNFYKPDFLVVSETGITFYEVKGFSASNDRSLVKMKTAAGIHLWAKFILVKRIGGQWEERHVQ